MKEISFKKKIIFSLLAICMLFLFIETTARVVYYVKTRKLEFLLAPWYKKQSTQVTIYETKMDYIKDQRGKTLYYKYKPGHYFHETRKDKLGILVRYYVNKDGLRNKDIQLKKEKYRIAVFGGSSVAGLESPDDKTFPAYLEKYLNQRKNGLVEVVNSGITSYSSDKIYNLLSLEVYDKFKPDMILLYMGRNDVHHNTGRLVLDKWYKKYFYYLHSKFKYRVMSYTYFIEKLSILKQGHPNPYLFYPFDPFPDFLKNFKKIIRFAKEKKIKVVYVCQVKNYNGNPEKMIEMINNFQKGHTKPQNKSDLRESFILKLFKLQALVKEIAEKDGNMQFIDSRLEFYSSIMGKNGAYFANNGEDPIHLTPLGNEVLGKIIAEKLILSF